MVNIAFVLINLNLTFFQFYLFFNVFINCIKFYFCTLPLILFMLVITINLSTGII